MLEVGVLGMLRARAGDDEVVLGGPRQRMVLAHLAVARDHTVSTDTLINDLWTTPPRDPVHALQAHISRLRAAIPIPITLTSAGYGLEPGQVVVDAHTFENEHTVAAEQLRTGDPAGAAQRWQAALDLWRGAALDGLDSAALQPVAARLERLRVGAAGDRIDAYLACGRTAEAIVDLYELVEREPLVERHWSQLMTALHLEGHLSEALETYRRARTVIVGQLGTEPSEVLQSLHQSLLRGSPAALLTVPRSAVTRDSRIVGRTRELKTLSRLWTQAQHGLRVVTISGESGIGKTRLAAEFAASLAATGVGVAAGRCDEIHDVAFQPFIDMLRADCAGRSGSALAARLGPLAGELTRLLPELVDLIGPDLSSPAHADPALERYHLMDALVAWLKASSRSAPLCLFIDDVQWADAETAAALSHLLASASALPLLVILTYRHHEAAGVDARLASLTRQSEVLTHLPLSGLSPDEVDELVGLELDTTPAPDRHSPADVAAQVRDSAGGNPLFVLELTRQLAGTDRDPSPGSDRLILPSGLREVIRQRAARLTAPVRRSLQVAAVIGREFEPTVLAEAADLGVDDADDHLVAGVAHRLIEQHSAAPLRFRFCHDAVRAALYDEWKPMERARLHHRIAEAIEKHMSPGDAENHHLRLGHHYAHASTKDAQRRASQHLVRAADLSSERRAYVAAAQIYRQAEELADPQRSAAERCDLMIVRGTAEFYAGDPAFRDTLLIAARDAARTGQVRQLVQAVVANHRGWYSSTTGVDRDRVELIDLALLRCPTADHPTRARLNAMWAMENVREPLQREQVLRRSARAVQLAEDAGDPDLLIDILCDRFSVLYATFEDPHGCVDLAMRIDQLSRTSADEGHLLNAAIAVAQSTMMTGDFATSDDALMLAESLAERVHRPVRLWLARVWIATRTAMRGDLAHAEELASEAFELGASLDQPDAFAWFAGQLFNLRYLADRTPELMDAIEEQVAQHAAAIPAWQAALAFTYTTTGRDEDARRIIKEFTRSDFANLPKDMLRLVGLAYLASACARLDDPESARAVYAQLVPFTAMFAHNGTIDAGPIDLHLGALAAGFGDVPLARRHLEAARQQCEVSGAGAWRVHVDRWLDEL